MQLCRYLRWKTQSKDSDDPAAVVESLLRSQVPFGCLRTCQAWGPDDEIASPDRCDRTRACFELDPIVGPPDDEPVA